MLTAAPGTWSGTAPITFTYAWQRCDSSGGHCGNVGGANATTYIVQKADVGHTLRVVVTGKHVKSSVGVHVGSVRYDLSPGRSRAVAVKLTKAGDRAIGRAGRLAVKAIATTAGAGKVAHSTRRLTLVLRTTKLRIAA